VALLDNAGVSAPQKSELAERLERGERYPLIVKEPEDVNRLLEFVFGVAALLRAVGRG
jgi:hypothetical protein